MKLQTDDYTKMVLLLVCLVKVYHDAGITVFDRAYQNDELSMDYYYDAYTTKKRPTAEEDE